MHTAPDLCNVSHRYMPPFKDIHFSTQPGLFISWSSLQTSWSVHKRMVTIQDHLPWLWSIRDWHKQLKDFIDSVSWPTGLLWSQHGVWCKLWSWHLPLVNYTNTAQNLICQHHLTLTYMTYTWPDTSLQKRVLPIFR